MSVIGCVYGAHRALVKADGVDAPPYDWCEREWLDRLRKTAPAGNALPDWLRQELWAAWRRECAGDRPERFRQATIWEAS